MRARLEGKQTSQLRYGVFGNSFCTFDLWKIEQITRIFWLTVRHEALDSYRMDQHKERKEEEEKAQIAFWNVVNSRMRTSDSGKGKLMANNPKKKVRNIFNFCVYKQQTHQFNVYKSCLRIDLQQCKFTLFPHLLLRCHSHYFSYPVTAYFGSKFLCARATR